MVEEFAKSVEDGLRLAKRIYFGKDRAVAPPKPMTAMDMSMSSYLPTAPMVYAIIGDPTIVDNPDIPSYQPHVHGRCDPPALIPLQMNGISLEAECYLDTVFIILSGSWRVHCVTGSRSCHCRIAIPMGEQGSVLSVEVDVPRKSYSTQLVSVDDKKDEEKVAKAEDGGFLKSHIFILTIPQVDGGSNISIKVRWSKKLLFHEGEFSVSIPFSFPEYVTPAGKKISKKEKIELCVNSGSGTEVLCNTISHPLKELSRQAGKLGFLYEAEVLAWSRNDFKFKYTVSSSHIIGNVILQSPTAFDIDQREIFCFYFFPGSQRSRKVFRREVVFVVDISKSTRETIIEDTKHALFAALSKLESEDLFNIIAFNDETYLFSSSLERATKEAVAKATDWIGVNFIAGGGTNILRPLNHALKMLSSTSNAIPIIFLITDGAVEDERHICQVMSSQLANGRSICPRIYTFGIGSFCNHYFLQMLAMIGRGLHDTAYDVDSIEVQIKGLFDKASSIVLANIAIDGLDDLQELEVYPSNIPDLSSERPLVVSGRYHGLFPNTLTARGVLPDMSNFTLDVKVQKKIDIPLEKVLAKTHIELLTAQAWFSQNKELEKKIVRMSIHNSVISEYTRMILLETEKGKKTIESTGGQKPVHNKTEHHAQCQKVILLLHLGVGFGDLAATAENIPPGSYEVTLPEPAEVFIKAASNCCGKLCGYCCCPCCIQTCSRMNDQCGIVLTQLCGALACLGCFSCCNLCCCEGD